MKDIGILIAIGLQILGAISLVVAVVLALAIFICGIAEDRRLR